MMIKISFLIHFTIAKECYDPERSWEYTGSVDFTVTGEKCMNWRSGSTHSPKHYPTQAGSSNFCRNPDNDPTGPWCYTTDPNVRFGYCNVPFCDDSRRKTKEEDINCISEARGLNYRGTQAMCLQKVFLNYYLKKNK
ncbi:unnamed protein product [Oikopleura dioica]|uniref:Kringle domain-containing protein n=1 Tax=Oikopleura dioica TaxID=34765 RepID=E4XS92_OIKDI|nr:unnamed protein product [Oikopleura dioica]CBY32435.1 unnamed protein product [Oikopleura dioica]